MGKTPGRGPRRAAANVVILVLVGIGVFLATKSDKRVARPAEPSRSPSICENKRPSYMVAKHLRDEPFPMSIDESRTYQARIATSCGTLNIDLMPKQSPIAVNNFVNLANAHWFNATYFFRISKSPGFIQAGDPGGTGDGGPGYTVPGDTPNGPKYQVGVMAMWNGENGKASSQFIIITGADGLDQLPPGLTVFGKLSDDTSLQVAQKIASVPTDAGESSEKVWILGVRIEEKKNP